MKIAVIAANGKSGRAFVKAALAAGHTVTAGVHNKNSLQPDTLLTVVTCDATKLADVKKLVQGQDIIVSLIGHNRKTTSNIQTRAMQNLIKVIDKQKLISLTGSGVRLPGDKVAMTDHILNAMLKRAARTMVQDGIDHLACLQASQINWTVIRALVLTNGKLASFKLLEHGPTTLLTSRNTVAQAILQIINDSSFKRQAPVIGR
jgi:putative NADH-flavin reductase